MPRLVGGLLEVRKRVLVSHGAGLRRASPRVVRDFDWCGRIFAPPRTSGGVPERFQGWQVESTSSLRNKLAVEFQDAGSPDAIIAPLAGAAPVAAFNEVTTIAQTGNPIWRATEDARGLRRGDLITTLEDYGLARPEGDRAVRVKNLHRWKRNDDFLECIPRRLFCGERCQDRGGFTFLFRSHHFSVN